MNLARNWLGLPGRSAHRCPPSSCGQSRRGASGAVLARVGNGSTPEGNMMRFQCLNMARYAPFMCLLLASPPQN